MRRFAAFLAGLALILAFAPAPRAAADPGGEGQVSGVTDPLILALIGNDDVFSLADLTTVLAPLDPNGAQHYGPFASGSPDSSTCGGSWADDTFDRVFTVRQTGPATFTVVEQFKNGSFITRTWNSPGACDSSDGTPPGVITAGIHGTMHGYEIISVTGTQISSDSSCIAEMPFAECTTAGFLSSHFGGASTIGTFFDHYAGYDGANQQLVVNEWKNASDDRGGNHGDIASAQP
jgi:hypothetical protein